MRLANPQLFQQEAAHGILFQDQGPIIDKITNSGTETTNHFRPGDYLVIRGQNLLFEAGERASDEGPFLISSTGEVALEQFFYVKKRQLVITLPDLEPGEYYFEVRTRMGTSEMRFAQWPQAIRIQTKLENPQKNAGNCPWYEVNFK